MIGQLIDQLSVQLISNALTSRILAKLSGASFQVEPIFGLHKKMQLIGGPSCSFVSGAVFETQKAATRLYVYHIVQAGVNAVHKLLLWVLPPAPFDVRPGWGSEHSPDVRLRPMHEFCCEAAGAASVVRWRLAPSRLRGRRR